jgi:hypothetical protein
MGKGAINGTSTSGYSQTQPEKYISPEVKKSYKKIEKKENNVV